MEWIVWLGEDLFGEFDDWGYGLNGEIVDLCQLCQGFDFELQQKLDWCKMLIFGVVGVVIVGVFVFMMMLDGLVKILGGFVMFLFVMEEGFLFVVGFGLLEVV